MSSVKDSILPATEDILFTKTSNPNVKTLTKKAKINQNNTISETNVQEPTGNTSTYEIHNKPNNTQKTYSKAAQNSHTNNLPQQNNNDSSNLTNQLSSFISEFKSIINPLITLLTTVINKFLLKND